jgi:predicted phosphodiesterase
MNVAGSYNNILFISDMHIPYGHPDTLAFLTKLKETLKPELVVCLGDELDYHAISFHKPNPDLFSPGTELTLAKEQISRLYKIFPKMLLVESNHGSLVYRKIKDAGIPIHVLKSYKELLEAPAGWSWHEDLLIRTKDGEKIYVCHGRSSNVLKESQINGMNFVSGHWHSSFNIQYWANKRAVSWGMSCGCLVDQNSLAYEYSKNFSKKFIVGTGALVNGQPKLFRMVLNDKDRWNKEIV